MAIFRFYMKYLVSSYTGLFWAVYNGRLQLKCDGTRWRTVGEVKGKHASGVGSQYSSHYLRNGVSSIRARLKRDGTRPNQIWPLSEADESI